MKNVQKFTAEVTTADSAEWKLLFPSSSRDELNDIYEKFDKYYDKVKTDPEQKNHVKLMNDALKSFVTTLAKLARAEESLY